MTPAKREQIRRHNDLAVVLGTPEGRRFVWRLLQESNVFGPAASDPGQMPWLEGRRSIGADLMKTLLTDFLPCLGLLLRENREGAPDGDRVGSVGDGERDDELGGGWG